MKIYIASDYRGVEVKEKIKEYLLEGAKTNNWEVLEIGLANKEVDDYQDFAFKLGELVRDNQGSLGILICGNGIGMSIAANKVKGIRCVRATSVMDAYDGREHNDANVLAIGANNSWDLNKEIVKAFLTSEGTTLERRIKRVEAIIKYEQGEYNEL